MKKIFAVCGSIRKQSSNMGLLLAIESIVGKESFCLFKDIGKFPHFSPDLEIPQVVQEFKNKISKANLLSISTPEYAHGIPGLLKNALDWIVSDEDFPGKKVVLIFASTGDAEFVKRSLSEVLRTMSADVDEKRIININSVRNKVDYSEEFLNNEIKNDLNTFVGFLNE
jgi:NAD(P)H-dependent FMN reductase